MIPPSNGFDRSTAASCPPGLSNLEESRRWLLPEPIISLLRSNFDEYGPGTSTWPFDAADGGVDMVVALDRKCVLQVIDDCLVLQICARHHQFIAHCPVERSSSIASRCTHLIITAMLILHEHFGPFL